MVQITAVYLLVNTDPTAEQGTPTAEQDPSAEQGTQLQEQAVSLDCVVCWSNVFISQVWDSEITKQYFTVPSGLGPWESTNKSISTATLC